MFAIVQGIRNATMEIDGDEYIPITAHADVELQGEAVGLQYGDYNCSLLEIIFDSETGIVRRLAMPAWREPK